MLQLSCGGPGGAQLEETGEGVYWEEVHLSTHRGMTQPTRPANCKELCQGAAQGEGAEGGGRGCSGPEQEESCELNPRLRPCRKAEENRRKSLRAAQQHGDI